MSKYNSDGQSDLSSLLTILKAKKAEEERLSKILEIRIVLLQLHAQRQGFIPQGPLPGVQEHVQFSQCSQQEKERRDLRMMPPPPQTQIPMRSQQQQQQQLAQQQQQRKRGREEGGHRDDDAGGEYASRSADRRPINEIAFEGGVAYPHDYSERPRVYGGPSRRTHSDDLDLDLDLEHEREHGRRGRQRDRAYEHRPRATSSSSLAFSSSSSPHSSLSVASDNAPPTGGSSTHTNTRSDGISRRGSGSRSYSGRSDPALSSEENFIYLPPIREHIRQSSAEEDMTLADTSELSPIIQNQNRLASRPEAGARKRTNAQQEFSQQDYPSSRASALLGPKSAFSTSSSSSSSFSPPSTRSPSYAPISATPPKPTTTTTTTTIPASKKIAASNKSSKRKNADQSTTDSGSKGPSTKRPRAKGKARSTSVSTEGEREQEREHGLGQRKSSKHSSDFSMDTYRSSADSGLGSAIANGSGSGSGSGSERGRRMTGLDMLLNAVGASEGGITLT